MVEIAGMSVAIRGSRLRLEITRRGWAAADLAREAHLSQATVAAALQSRPIAPRSLVSIIRALERTPALDGVDAILDGPDVPGVG